MDDKTIGTQVERLKESLNQMVYERDYFERLASEQTEKVREQQKEIEFLKSELDKLK